MRAFHTANAQYECYDDNDDQEDANGYRQYDHHKVVTLAENGNGAGRLSDSGGGRGAGHFGIRPTWDISKWLCCKHEFLECENVELIALSM